VNADDLLKESSQLAPLRPVTGVGPKLADTELVTPAVRQALPVPPRRPGGYGSTSLEFVI
jgi:hypothetical protein